MEEFSAQQFQRKHREQPNSEPPKTQDSFNKIYDECELKTIAIFLAFKFVPILLYCLPTHRYLLFKFATNQYLSTFIVTSILLSADFWFTKNIAGRQLAALRWYSRLNDENEEKWCFQSSQVRVPATINVFIFWVGQLVPVLFWVSILLINIVTLSLFWVFLALFCCVLLIANFGLFLECKGDHQKRVNGITKRLGIEFFELNEEKA